MMRTRMPTIEEAIEALNADENRNKTLEEMKEEIQVLIEDRNDMVAREKRREIEDDERRFLAGERY